MLEGNWNGCLDPVIERSHAPLSMKSTSMEVMKSYLADLGLADIWQILNSTMRDYSFLSQHHSVYSRIDYFLNFSKHH